MKMNCIIIEDEPLAIAQLESYISQVNYLELVRSFNNAIEPLEFLKSSEIDLIFLDVEMEYLTGIQFAKLLKKEVKIILTTAYDQYALEAFDLDICDYLLKPISFDRFLKAVNKLKSGIQENNSIPKQRIQQEDQRSIFVKSEYKLIRIDIDDILYIEGQKEYLRIHTKKERIMTLMNFKQVLNLLDDNFMRIHNSYVVSINKIDKIENKMAVINNAYLPISESYKTQFYQALADKQMINKI